MASDDKSELLLGTSLGFLLNVQTSDLSGFILSENHTKPVTYVSFPRGISDKFATSSEDGSIRIWDGSDYSAISRCFVSNAGSPTSFVLTLEIIISGWEDGKIRAFRADNGQSLWTIDNAHRGGVTSLVISSNQRFIVSGGTDGEIRVWEIRSKDMISHLKEHTSKITDLKLLSDDIHLISVSRDKCMLTWDLRSDKRVAAHAQRMGGINTLDTGSDANLVVTAGQERKISKWDLRQTTPFVSIDAGPGDSDEIYTLAMSYSGRYFATGGEKMILRIWDFENMRIIGEGHGHSGVITHIAWSYDDKQVVTTGKDNCVLIWMVMVDIGP